jgi:predicted ATP-grasp superfamily ATP-dependent carboligase
MRVFVYEYLVALGIGRDPADPFHPMYREGRAMRDAVAADFARLPGVEVVRLDSAAEEDNEELIGLHAGRCDWTVLIAPELGGELERCCWSVWKSGGRLLGPGPEAVRLTSDKLALAEHWRTHGVPTPATTDREPTPCEHFPVVWKPRDGAGSTATFLLRDALDVARAKAHLAADGHSGPMILQEFVPGRAASVAFLCGPHGNVPLPPAFQVLSDDGRFKYLGGELPVPEDASGRVVAVAARALTCVPDLLGYVGVDVVLGDAADGSRDVAVEINPRLTTSYVGLRAHAGFNLAGAMLAVASGDPFPPPVWRPGRVRWFPDGKVENLG